MFEEKANVHISIEMKKGKTRNIIGFTDVEDDSFGEFDGAGVITISENDAIPGEMHYVFVKNIEDGDSEISILITVDRTVITLSEGVPMDLTFNGYNDMSKFFVFGLPEG